MSEARTVANRLYKALAEDDGRTLAELLHPEFTGTAAAGLPLGIGGPVSGPKQMLRGVWGAIAKEFDTTPEPAELVEVGTDRVVVFGTYRGSARKSGRRFEAAFTHDLTVRDGKLASLVQVTDTHAWHEALAAPDS